MYLIEASIEFGIRPTSLILHTQPQGKWSNYDFLLLEAYKLFTMEKCGQCSLPRYICQNEDNDIQFKLIEEQCAATVEKERHDERERKNRGDNPQKGIAIRTEPFSVSGKKLTEFRLPFYEAKAKAKAEELEIS